MTQQEIINIYLEHMCGYLKEFLWDLIRSLPLVFVLILVVGIFIYIYEKSAAHKLSANKKISIFVFVAYVTVIVFVTVISRQMGYLRHIEIIPFSKKGGFSYVIFYAIINLIVFLPLGYLLPTIFKRMRLKKKIIVVGFTSSFCIEIMQYILACGDSQTEDLIMNTVGCALGYRLWQKIRNRREI